MLWVFLQNKISDIEAIGKQLKVDIQNSEMFLNS